MIFSIFSSVVLYLLENKTSHPIQSGLQLFGPKKVLVKKKHKGAGEMSQQLGALTAPPEVLSSIPSKHMVAQNRL